MVCFGSGVIVFMFLIYVSMFVIVVMVREEWDEIVSGGGRGG